MLSAHLPIVPVVLPLASAALMLLLDERRYAAKAVMSLVSLGLLIAAAVHMVRTVDAPATLTYALGDWAAPFGIVLVADRVSAALVLLASVLGLAAMVFSLARWHRVGPRYHVLVQVLLAGLNGAFLTGDVFNLFVFFELFLAASYGLALYGSGRMRVQAGLHYLTINLAASLLFLVGASLLYGVAGTLNMADLARRAADIAAGDRVLFEAGAAILGIAFLVKAGMWPLCFWLPGTYAAAAAPAAALFAILSKVGVYAVLRVWLLLFGPESGASAGFGAHALIYGGLVTLGFGAIGVLGSQQLARVAGYSLLASAGTLLASIGAARPEVTAAALYYLVVSTLAVSALYLMIELVERMRTPGADVLAVTAEAFGEVDGEPEPETEIGVPIPAAAALLALSFGACALLVAGLPPLPGFLAKLALLSAWIEIEAPGPLEWVVVGLLSLASLAAVIAFGRAGVRIFWAGQTLPPHVRVTEIAPVLLLLGITVALAVEAGTAMDYFLSAARSLHERIGYIDAVLTR